MIRPEIKDGLWRWREVIASIMLIALGLWWGFASFGIVQWLGWGLALVGCFAAFGAAQRVRFGVSSDGPGVVTLDERRVIYMGPTGGGIADLDLIVRLELTPQPHAVWRLTNEDGNTLDIPINASGAEGLFDLFNTLPGIRTHMLVGSIDVPRPQTVVIWRSGKDQSFTQLPPTVH